MAATVAFVNSHLIISFWIGDGLEAFAVNGLHLLSCDIESHADGSRHDKVANSKEGAAGGEAREEVVNESVGKLKKNVHCSAFLFCLSDYN